MWAEKELEYVQMGNLKLKKRLTMLLKALTKDPQSSIPEACNSAAATKGAYRFFSNENVKAKKIKDGSYQATKMRIKKHPNILIISDATNLNYSSHKSLRGIGVLKNFRARGLNLHTTIAITPNGVPLGMLDQACWGRLAKDYGKRALRSKLPIKNKESYRWIEALRKSQKYVLSKTKAIFVADRGADIYDIFLQPRKKNIDLLIRAAHDRKIFEKSAKIFTTLESSHCMATTIVKIKRSGNRKERDALLELRFIETVVSSPTHRKELPPVKLTIISAQEKSKLVKNPIKWRLLTTLSILNGKEAAKAVETYAKRWTIERFHYTLKQGCGVEELQLEDSNRIERAVVLYSIVALRIMYMMHLSRTSPETPCAAIFTEDEWTVLTCYNNNSPTPSESPPSIHDAVFMVAKLGGFLARKGDGNPGVKVIWRGLRKLKDFVHIASIFKKKVVGNA